jgi:hypothetical protein
MKTTNAGTNWILQSSGVTANLYDLSFVNVTTGWAVGASGNIIKTTDGGSTWLAQNSPSSSAALNAMHMVDANTGYIVGSGGILLKTTNGGGPPILPFFQKIVSDPITLDNGYYIGAYPCDYDNDGYQDILEVQYNDGCFSCNYPIMLFHNNGNGSFTKVTSGPIATLVTKAFCATWGDYDNDGNADLFISRGFNQGNLLFHNEGNGNFTQVTTGPIATDAGDSRGCAWIDYDRDGWLDLFVCNQSNQSNFLYHNNGNGTFTKITSGSIVTDVGWSRGCAWGDYDNDRWPDLYVCNYNNLNPFLYHNNGNGTFTRVYNVLTSSSMYGTTCAWGDYNNDGWLDLAVTNSNQNNQLFQNLGNGNFVLSSTIVNSDGGVTSNPAWEDYDNDGYLDLFIAKFSGNNLLYHNILGNNFNRITNEVLTTQSGSSGSWFDYNNDGKVDILVTSYNNAQNSLFRNIGTTGNYLTVKLHGCNTLTGRSNTMGIGARIKIRYGGNQQIREVIADNTNNMLWQHFGLGSVSMIDSVIVYWTSGNIQKLTNVSANQMLLVDECLVGIVDNQNQVPTEFGLLQNYPNPFNPVTKIKFQLPKRSFVNLIVYDIMGREVETLVNSEKSAGYYELEFNGEKYSSGIYIYKITAGNYVESKKMVLIK